VSKRPPHYDDPSLGPEARAFDQRIKERVEAGFVPDLQHAKHCDFFYKSFWRDPLFIDLYEGEVTRTYLRLLQSHCGDGLKILDVGCGAGYVSLEIARGGHHVLGIDISAECIKVAEQTRDKAPKGQKFGSLEYAATPLSGVAGTYDVVLFSVALHHFPDIEGAIAAVNKLLKPGGFLLCCEPCHEIWREEDAAQVAFIRSLLAAVGVWYDPAESADVRRGEAGLADHARAVLVEYAEERDPHEVAQSPNDLEQDGGTILKTLRAHYRELAYELGASFIYRLLGGIRADAPTTERVARLLAAYDRYVVQRKIIRPNFFYFLGRRA
jgi:2-polyprenyl-3-methyl-5-hydroxy-6-metoxy-1,4-benzoquinol methylase